MAKKILLADDSLTIQKVVELTFSDGDYDLVCVSNGQKALDKVREDRPDLILADVVMPEKNGYEVCEAIKGNPATSRIPVVLLSGTFEPFDRERAERIGCDAIVSKPFDSQQLISQVEALLGKIRGEAMESEPLAVRASAGAAEQTEKAPFDNGFSSDDFTASIRMPPHPERFDPFEEEYARGDADAAILAFEKAHPEFSTAGSDDGGSAPKENSSGAPWLVEDSEPAVSGSARGGIWSAADEEPDRPLDFDAERTGSLQPSHRADDGPTQEIPQQPFRSEGRYSSEPRAAAPGRNDERSRSDSPWGDASAEEISADDAEILFDVSSGEEEEEPERSAAPMLSDEPMDQASLDGNGEPAGDSRDVERESAAVPAEGAPADSSELEALAQTASIPELTTMLSSVMRSAGSELSDAEIDRLAQRVVEKLSDRVVREIAWEVIPDMAEIVIKERIKELESGAE